MKTQQIEIYSYFSRPTDLATELSDIPEYKSGEGYDVELESEKGKISVSYVQYTDDELPRVIIKGLGRHQLFEQVLGRVIYALSANTDNIMVRRLDEAT